MDYKKKIVRMAEKHRFDPSIVIQSVDNSVRQLIGTTVMPPVTLYHYTNVGGLFGILRSNVLWATHYEYLNDPSEVVQLTQVAHEIFKQELDSFPESLRGEVVSDTPENLRINLMKIFCSISDLSGHYAPYVISFSTDEDALGQWRAYADNGHGYALGFRYASLVDLVENSNNRVYLWPVFYDQLRQQQLVKSIFNAVFEELVGPFFATKSGFVTNEAFRMALDCMHRLFAMVAPIAKHQAYSEEQEWRIVVDGIRPEAVLDKYRQTPLPNSPLISQSDNELEEYNVRVSGRRIIPYTTVHLPEDKRGDLFDCLVVGPCQRTPSTGPALKLLLHRCGLYPGMLIHESGVPYRVD